LRFPKIKLRFGLRTLLVLIVLVSIPCALFGQRFRAAYLTSRLTRLASSDDIHIVAEWRYSRWGMQREWEWRDLFDADLQLLHYLKLEGEHIRDQDVSTIGVQDHLIYLVLANTSVTDQTVRRLRSCSKLGTLSLYGCKEVNGEGFEGLTHLPSLASIELTRTGITDASLLHVARIPNLFDLDLGHTQITDHGVSGLKVASNLDSLQLQDTLVEGKCLAALSTLPNLRVLNLSRTPLATGSFKDCAPFRSLIFLYVSNTNIGDEDLLRIAEICDLQAISIRQTRITDEAIERFKELEPDCEINP
jgi:Leucine-rich repeat (LRR) protein